MGVGSTVVVVVDTVTAATTATATAAGAEVSDRIDENSERWVTAVHEAGHAVAVDELGYRITDCWIHPDDDRRGGTNHTATDGPDRAIVSVAGERATRLLLGCGGGSRIDYDHAAHALTGTGHSIDWAEDHADQIIGGRRRDILLIARRLYRGRL